MSMNLIQTLTQGGHQVLPMWKKIIEKLIRSENIASKSHHVISRKPRIKQVFVACKQQNTEDAIFITN